MAINGSNLFENALHCGLRLMAFMSLLRLLTIAPETRKNGPVCFFFQVCMLTSLSFFQHTLVDQTFTHVQHVPRHFARQHIQENKKTATLRYSKRLWPVKLSRYTNETRVSFSAGWPAFARETHLCVGNACMFELIDRDDVVFKVSIFSSSGKDPIRID